MVLAVAVCAAGAAPAAAERAPVLRQIDLPHSYYYREMYLPQATSGPASPTFSPDGKSLIYSMAGSLWRQEIGSDQAFELTHSAGYDHQPDWSPDGRSVVFVRYQDDAMEIWRLNLADGRETQLTVGGAVNVEPRHSPDGRTLAFVSTKGTGHFVLHKAAILAARLGVAGAVVPDRKSGVKRYYYSAWDHAISPSWTPDGKRIVFVSNRDKAYGSGGIWSVAADGSEPPRLLHREETTWRARPEVAPDGRRILYSSYSGRQWHQLWLTTLDGGAPLPLTFGDFDRTDARWSPRGDRIAFVSNEDGDTKLWVQTFAGGALQRVEPRVRHYRVPRADLHIQVLDEQRRPVSARVSVAGTNGRFYAPDSLWMHADDGFDRNRQRSETRYFHCRGACRVSLPLGVARMTVWRGLESEVESRTVRVAGTGASAVIGLKSLRLPEWSGPWASADLHVHMNYGGRYRATPATLAAQAQAEDLDFVYNLVVNKEQRIPDIATFSNPPYSEAGITILQAQEHHSSYWGHLGLLHLAEHYVTPDFTAYDGTALASPYPHNGVIADVAHRQKGLVGYVHPFDFPVRPESDPVLTNALPADVAQGRVDYYEVVGFSDHKASADIWHRLLNLGFRLAPGAGTDAMTNFASLRGPVGLNRLFVSGVSAGDAGALRRAVKEGRSFATNGPLLALEMEGRRPGGEVRVPAGRTLRFRASLRSIVPVDHFELLHNGKVLRKLKVGRRGTLADAAGDIRMPSSGWVTLRAYAERSNPLIFDLYPYAETGPVYVQMEGSTPRFPDDAAYFVRWLDRVIASAEARGDYNSETERTDTLAYLRAARAKFEAFR
ncbi:MAG TPA: CehA/McbA family metallohydrolase [Allosphingosinicella sp.]|nr:CehA/McbA family metallohydrolase [Allosphingosinicella sp.]